MHEDTLDDAILLGLLGQRYQTFVGIVIIGGEHALHPVRRFVLHVIVDTVRKESLDVDTTNGHVDDTNLDVFRQ